jgi:hypothetical protein
MGRLLHGGGGREGQIGGREGAEVEGSLSGFWPPAREAAPVGSGRWGKTGEWSCCVLRRRECVLWGSLLSKELEQPSLVEVALGFFFSKERGANREQDQGVGEAAKGYGEASQGLSGFFVF